MTSISQLGHGDYCMEWFVGDGAALTIFAGISSLLVAGILFDKWLKKKRGTKIVVVSNKEAAKLRYEVAAARLSDCITNEIQDMVVAGEITMEDADKWYRRLGSQKLPDLIPRRTEDLKRNINLRLRLFDWKPVSIPGPLPVQDVKPKAKVFGGTLLSKLKPAVQV